MNMNVGYPPLYIHLHPNHTKTFFTTSSSFECVSQYLILPDPDEKVHSSRGGKINKHISRMVQVINDNVCSQRKFGFAYIMLQSMKSKVNLFMD
jgi:hypothetical protein